MITRIIVFALIIYAGISLITIRGKTEAVQDEMNEVRKAVAELELANAELEYELENRDNPAVIADIARSNLGLVLPGEIVFFDGGAGYRAED
jgi:cell division protein FtsL